MRRIAGAVLMALLVGGCAVQPDMAAGRKACFDHGDAAAARAHLVPLARDGDPEAQRLMGTAQCGTQPLASDEPQALTWLAVAAVQDDLAAQIALAERYAEGRAVERDPVREATWREKAAARDPKQFLWLGRLALDAQDCAKAQGYFTQAAAAGVAKAAVELGDLARNGRCGAADKARALAHYTAAADAGEAEGMLRLGWMHYLGESMAKSCVRAADYWWQAADRGNAEAMATIGSLYRDGCGVDQDIDLALYWLEKAALAADITDYPEVAEVAAVAYTNHGRGAPLAAVRAYAWLVVANIFDDTYSGDVEAAGATLSPAARLAGESRAWDYYRRHLLTRCRDTELGQRCRFAEEEGDGNAAR